MLVNLSNQDVHASELMGADTVRLCEMQGFKPRLDNKKQSRVEANVYGFKAEFAVARLFNIDPPVINVVTDGGVDLWFNDISIDVKFNNAEFGKLIFDSMDKFKSQLAVLVGRTDNPKVMRINGWIRRTSFEEKSYAKNFGYGDRLFMDHKDLLPVELLWKSFMEYKFKR